MSLGAQGFWESGENVYLFSGSWGTLVIIFRDLGSKLIVLGFREPCKKVLKKSHLKGKAFISFDFFFKNLRLLGGSPQTPLGKSKSIYLNLCQHANLIGIGD